MTTEERQAALEKLAAFGWACLREHRDHMGDIDGFFAQHAAIDTGVLVSRQVFESCGGDCDCVWHGFPTECLVTDDACREVGKALERVAERKA